jgi:catalase
MRHDDEQRPKVDENAKVEQLGQYGEDPDDEFLTTDQGVRINDTDNSLKAGGRGPTLMEDFIFREKLTHFDHEPIPERVVHARGSGAHGYFQVYEPMTEYTSARFLQDPSVKTPVFVRFSQVVGFRGSADTVRDVRGFATKFYTDDGNYDLVGNNIPIFFIQDAIKFPDLVHSIKPEQDSEMPQASAAHDTFWDFISLLPESMAMIMWLLSDRGIHRSYRMMDGFGVNTFRLVNEQGVGRFVKFHWKTTLGTHALVWDEAQKLAGKDPDFLRRDLWEAIEMGDYPEYELGVQLLDEEDEHAFNFDILDPTKFWPEEFVPVMPVGKMTLNRNPDNFHAETEQVAFHPGNVVPGIDFSNDPLLQGRLFSYLDTQLIRLGGPNFTELPINQPLVRASNYHRGAYHRQTINRGPVAYWPNSLRGRPRPAEAEEGPYLHYQEKVEGSKIRERSESFGDHFTQAKFFWNSQTEPEQTHIIEAFHFELGKVKSREVRERMVGLISQVDGELAAKVAKGIGVASPSGRGSGASGEVTMRAPDGKTRSVTSSAAINMLDTVKTPKGRKVAILAADGCSGKDVQTVKSALMDAGATVKIVAKFLGSLTCDDGSELPVDKNYQTTASIMYDAVFVPGGPGSAQSLMEQGYAKHFVNEAFKHGKPVAASGEGVQVLQVADLAGVELVTVGSGRISEDKGVVTSMSPASEGAFMELFLTAIAEHRHWDRDMKEKVPA